MLQAAADVSQLFPCPFPLLLLFKSNLSNFSCHCVIKDVIWWVADGGHHRHQLG